MSNQDKPPSLTDLLVARALADLADDWVTRWLLRLATVVMLAAAVFLAWVAIFVLPGLLRR